MTVTVIVTRVQATNPHGMHQINRSMELVTYTTTLDLTFTLTLTP